VNRTDTPSRVPTVTWLPYRAPAKVTFSPSGSVRVTDGQAATTVSFAEPGIYKLLVSATDGALSTRTELTITVTGSASNQ
jgi:hypothetical protein